MFTVKIIAVAVSVASIAFAAMAPVAPSAAHSFSRDRSLMLTEASVNDGTLRNSGASELYASLVTIAIPARIVRHVGRVIINAPTVYTCQTRDLIQGSGQVTECSAKVAR